MSYKQHKLSVYAKCNGRCGYCGLSIEEKHLTIDHIISQYNFRKYISEEVNVPVFLSHLTTSDVDHIDNLMPCCRKCNTLKAAYDIETFRSELYKQVERGLKTSVNFRLALMYKQIELTRKPIVFYFETLTNYQL